MCHMCHTQTLDLDNNKIGDPGVTALANACAGGALPKCTYLSLRRNPGNGAPVQKALREREV